MFCTASSNPTEFDGIGDGTKLMAWFGGLKMLTDMQLKTLKVAEKAQG